jgi:hypothetical protein
MAKMKWAVYGKACRIAGAGPGRIRAIKKPLGKLPQRLYHLFSTDEMTFVGQVKLLAYASSYLHRLHSALVAES